MARTETQALADRVASTFASLADIAAELNDGDLDKEIAGYGGRPTRVRNVLYAVANHMREHVNHINKILNVTGHPSQSEARAILDQAAQSLGALNGALLRVDDDDLARSHEDQTIASVLEHIIGTQENYATYLKEGLK